jgi:hypothetical protein
MKTFLLLLALSTAPSFAQECTHLWMPSIDINPNTPKLFSGDTFAVYGLIGFYDEPNLRLQFTGEFPKGRFMSLESYKTKNKNHVDVIYDHQIEPDAGSENPYQEGALMETPNRSYTVDLVKEGTEISVKNALKLAPKEKIHSVFYRAYVPSDGVVPTIADLPKIFAYDARTGAAANCPKTINTAFAPGLETIILKFIPAKKSLKFKIKSNFDNGTNKGIPGYSYALNKIPFGQVSVIRFKSPTFFDTQSGAGPFQHSGDVRYWSFCTQNLKASETLNCLPDYLAKPDKSGYVTLVIGGGKEVQTMAESKGWNFLDDRRAPAQKVAAYFYRNLLPLSGFPYYKGEYEPKGIVCKANEFLADKCNP